MLSILPVVLSVSMLSTSAPFSKHALLTSPTRHVRTTDAIFQKLFGIGLNRSPTLHLLMARLETTDVIVYVEPVSTLPATLAGRLLLAPDNGTQRYLRIQIAVGAPPNDTIALIAHELRHALEVADAPEVHNEATLIALYERIGDHSHTGVHQYDTVAARAMGSRVQHELLA